MDKKTRFVVSANYFAFFLCLGSFLPFITLFLQASGWSGFQIGMYTAIGPIISFLSQPLWGVVGDSWGNTKMLYALLTLTTSLTVFIFGLVPATSVFFLLALFLGIFQGPLNPLLDGLVLGAIGTENQPKLGQMRLWGSFSFAVVTFIVGGLFDLNNRIIFFTNSLLALTAIIAVMQLPNTKRIHTKFQLDLGAIKRVMTKPFYSFLLAVFLLQLAHHTSMSFLALLLAERGASSSMVGYSWGLTATIEIPVFFLSSKLLHRYAPEQLLIVAASVTTLRLVLLALIKAPALLVVIHAIDGMTFPLVLVSLTLIVYKLIPDQYKTTGLTVYFAFAQTLPRLIGGLAGGRIFDVWGSTILYLITAGLAFFGAISIWYWRTAIQREKNIVLSRGEQI